MASPLQPGPTKEEILKKLKEEPATWNQWWMGLGPGKRRETDLTGVDLRGASLRGRKLCDVNFERSDLTFADLSYSDLTSANLQTTQMTAARLLHANLADANLFVADLTGAVLQSANLKGTHLIRTRLLNANLRDADFSEIKGPLLPSQLAGADITGAKLPAPLEKLYDKLGTVSEISESAKKLFLALLAACLYSWLTIGTTKDVDLITDRASSPLPIIQTAIPIVGFYVIAPIILLCVYFYFHFYLQKLWEELAQLPAIFPDGKPLYQRADPWLFNDLVRAHFRKLKGDRPFLSYFQQYVSILLAWWLVPVTLLLFWGRYVPRHDLIWTAVLAVMLGVSIVSAWRLHRLAKETLEGEHRLNLREALKSRHPYVTLSFAMILLTLLILLSSTAIHSTPKDWVSRAMEWAHCSPFANLEDADVSIKPPNWTGKKDEELDLVKGADLKGKNLRYGQAKGAFLAKSNLEASNLARTILMSADLRFSNLKYADLTGAYLSDALMQGADMEGAKLEYAELTRAHLNAASLKSAHMSRADLSRADLTDAKLSHADLVDAQLSGAKLTGADLYSSTLASLCEIYDPPAEITYANLRNVQRLIPKTIINCKGWEMAFFDDDTINELKLPRDHNEALEAYRKSGSRELFDSWQKKWRQKQKERG